MKKTININLGGMAFIMDEDAYDALKRYLGEIEIRLDRSDDREVLEDIESRIADIFKENISLPSTQVVSIAMVRRAINIIGNANEFGEPKRTLDEDYDNTPKPRKLYRSRDDKLIGGVCDGLADYLNLDITLVRVITFCLIFFGGVSLLVYLVMWIIVPLEPRRLTTRTTRYYKE